MRCKFCCAALHPLQGCCISWRWRCGAVQTLTAMRCKLCCAIVNPLQGCCVSDVLALWRGANRLVGCVSFCRDPACPCIAPMNPVQGSCVSRRWRCASVHFARDEPSCNLAPTYHLAPATSPSHLHLPPPTLIAPPFAAQRAGSTAP